MISKTQATNSSLKSGLPRRIQQVSQALTKFHHRFPSYSAFSLPATMLGGIGLGAVLTSAPLAAGLAAGISALSCLPSFAHASHEKKLLPVGRAATFAALATASALLSHNGVKQAYDLPLSESSCISIETTQAHHLSPELPEYLSFGHAPNPA